MAEREMRDRLEQLTLLWRGLRGSCPRCGKGGIFKSYLVQNDACTGALVVPAAVVLSLHDVMPEWAAITTLLVLAVAIVLLMLPRAKGIFIAILWRIRQDRAAGVPPP